MKHITLEVSEAQFKLLTSAPKKRTDDYLKKVANIVLKSEIIALSTADEECSKQSRNVGISEQIRILQSELDEKLPNNMGVRMGGFSGEIYFGGFSQENEKTLGDVMVKHLGKEICVIGQSSASPGVTKVNFEITQ